MKNSARPLYKPTSLAEKSGLYREVQPNRVCTGNQIVMKKGDILPETERRGLLWRCS